MRPPYWPICSIPAPEIQTDYCLCQDLPLSKSQIREFPSCVLTPIVPQTVDREGLAISHALHAGGLNAQSNELSRVTCVVYADVSVHAVLHALGPLLFLCGHVRAHDHHRVRLLP